MQKKPKGVRGYILFKLLTAGIYTTFTRALREAVSNAYDAGATKVEITFNPAKFVEEQNPAALTVQVRDNGRGMSMDDFWTKFASIDSSKDPTKEDPETGRLPIGRFGIGSFALVPFARNLTIYSKKKGCPPIKCQIKASQLQEEGTDDFPEHVTKNISDDVITEDAWETLYLSDKPGTVIVVHGVTPETYAELRSGTGKAPGSFKGMFPAAKFTDGLMEIAWELSTVLPLKYDADPGNVYRDYRTALQTKNEGITIKLSGIELKRMIYSQPGCFVKEIDYSEKTHQFRVRGVILALADGAVQPREALGVVLRLNNVGVGPYRMFGVGAQNVVRNRVTGEVHILRGLQGAINAPRENFSGPAYDALANHLREEIGELISKAYTKWESRKNVEEEEEEKKVAARHARLAKERQSAEGPTTRTSGHAPQSTTSASRATNIGNAGALGPASQTKKPNQKDGVKGAAVHNGSPDSRTQQEDVASGHEDGPSLTHTTPAFVDPVISIDRETYDMVVLESHPLFRLYSGKREKRTIRMVLRVLKLEGIPEVSYQRIIRALLSLKLNED